MTPIELKKTSAASGRIARWGRIIGFALAAAALAGCSAIKVAYNNGAEVAYWWLDGYFDFSDEQTPRVREDLARLLAWHRANELPRYGRLLAKAEQLAPGNLTEAQSCEIAAEIRGAFTVLGERAEPAVVTTALSFGPDQVAAFERKLKKNDAEFRKDWLGPDVRAQKDKRLKQLVERAENLYGDLGPAQRAVLRQQIDASSYDAQRSLSDRQRRQQDALATLRKVAGQPIALDEARRLLRGYFDRSQSPPDAAARQYQEALVQESCRGIAVLHNSTTREQREVAVQRLRGWQRDIRELTAAAP